MTPWYFCPSVLSVRITALVVRALAAAEPVVSVNHQTLSESLTWLMFKAQQPDGSFTEESPYKSNRILVSASAYSISSSVLT